MLTFKFVVLVYYRMNIFLFNGNVVWCLNVSGIFFFIHLFVAHILRIDSRGNGEKRKKGNSIEGDFFKETRNNDTFLAYLKLFSLWLFSVVAFKADDAIVI